MLYQLSQTLMVPYAELMRLCDYRVPGEPGQHVASTVDGALFADLTEDERDELLDYLASYRARRGSRRGASISS